MQDAADVRNLSLVYTLAGGTVHMLIQQEYIHLDWLFLAFFIDIVTVHIVVVAHIVTAHNSL